MPETASACGRIRLAMAIVYPLTLLGFAAWRGPLGARVAITVLGYTAAFLFLGRTDNYYWGLITLPLLPLGLIWAIAALTTLTKIAFTKTIQHT